MPHPNSRLTPDEHATIGIALKAARDKIEIVTRYAPLGSPVHQEAIAALACLERLRTTLDNVLFLHVDDSMDPRLIRHMVYCPEARLRHRHGDGAKDKRDAFAHWEVGG